MGHNLKWRRVVTLHVTTLIAAIILGGCVSKDRIPVGRHQVGDAGGTCSFLTTVFGGPNVGRGRNEGYLKSHGEIMSLFDPFGMGNRKMTGNPFTFCNIFSDDSTQGDHGPITDDDTI